MIQVFHVQPVQNVQALAPGAAWSVRAPLWPASAAEELANDFVWLLIGY